jgi:hypothetical protein
MVVQTALHVEFVKAKATTAMTGAAVPALTAEFEHRLNALDWTTLERALDERGYATIPALLAPARCAELVAMYDERERFRSRVVMERMRFGVGEYKYFAPPLPPLVDPAPPEVMLKAPPLPVPSLAFIVKLSPAVRVVNWGASNPGLIKEPVMVSPALATYCPDPAFWTAAST